ncbi:MULTISPECIES: hypothetical protein [unclassified Leptolyngbya]|uniref:hypothetical protein n=1 Tax=unclassified Leptolyngbya TaxID=2650499 RepID=UPI001685B1FD|nr:MULTISPECIES: hypothetical protein [unclassified Leptolyngbya]MBD1909860.1 hypothetical protein [Leptolyngbya sp. FACHB-8]MBD2156956.1 hypothetical protein [Leptolyngbya sp. FACHB-16]
MARHVNQKCQQCAALAVEEAIALHGPEGDNCWNPENRNGWGYDCHRRRSHYRHRDDDNRTRRRLRRAAKLNPGGVAIAPIGDPDTPLELLPPPTTHYAAVLVLYRNRKDSPVHAIAAEIWQGDTKIHTIKAVHCLGMRGNEVADYIEQLLTQLHERFKVSRFESEPKELPVADCPLTPCPMKP